MKSNKRLAELAVEILQEMYEASEPPLDFKKFVKEIKRTGKCPLDWFTKHTLTEKQYKEIRDNFYKKHKLTETERSNFDWHLLNYAPKFTRDKGENEW